MPLWVGRCADDITVSAAAVAKLAARSPHGELHDYPGDHFAPFHGDLPARIIDDQVAFLGQALAFAARDPEHVAGLARLAWRARMKSRSESRLR